MRLTPLRSAAILTLCFAWLGIATLNAASPGVEAVYSVGNIEGVTVGDSGRLIFDGDEFTFKTYRSSFTARYRSVVDLELGPAVSKPSDEPMWKLHKRLAKRPVYRHLNLTLKSADGEEKLVTFELEENTAAEAHEVIEIRSGLRRAGKPSQVWWGDTMWRTNRNTPDWREDEARREEQAK